MYWSITGSIFLGGAGSVVVGGLYWKRGTTAGAYCGMIIGSVLAFTGGVVRALYPDFPVQGHWILAASMGSGIVSYVLVSLLGPGGCFNMDRMLHRGKYAISGDHVEVTEEPMKRWKKLVGITNEFTKADTVVYLLALAFIFGPSIICIAGGIYFYYGSTGVEPLGDRYWLRFWQVFVFFFLSVNTISFLLITLGGFIDIKNMLKVLRIVGRKAADDGRVVDHRNLADIEGVPDELKNEKED